MTGTSPIEIEMSPTEIVHQNGCSSSMLLIIRVKPELNMTDYKIIRKVYLQGGSLLVALPPVWAEAHGIDGDSKVAVLFDGDGVVRIQPIAKSRSASR